MTKMCFTREIERIEKNAGRKYTEDQLAFFWAELCHLTDMQFIETVQNILDKGGVRGLPQKIDFVEHSGGAASRSSARATVITPLHMAWEDGHECACECSNPLRHKG